MPENEQRYLSVKGMRILLHLPRLSIFSACSLMFIAFYPLVGRAQNRNVQYTNNSVDLGLRSNLTVNPSTRALEIQIPLGSYAGRAGLDVPIAINYSSKVHRIKYEAYNPGQYNSNGQPIGNGYTLVSDGFAEYSSAGWTATVGFPVQDYSSQGELFDMSGKAVGTDGQCNQQVYPFTPYPCYIIDRMLFRMPDGSTHELRSTDQPRLPNDPIIDDYYSVDGSRMHYQRSTQRLFMADGSRYELGANPKYIDRNGNTITNTDTLGRAISNPLAGAGEYVYSLPGVGGPISYTFKWKNLDDAGVLTSPQQQLPYIADSSCPVGNGSYSPHLFLSDPIGTRTCIVNGGSLFRPVVLYQIVLPHDPANPNPPTYTFTYNIYGEIDKVVLPTGGYERYEYEQVAPLTTNMVAPYLQENRGVKTRYVSASGLAADELPWRYSGGGGGVSITAPDLSLTELSMYTDFSFQGSFGYSPNQPRAGRTYSENFYSHPDANNVRHLLRRHLADWSVTGSNATSQFSGAQQAARNARLTREVEIIFDTGGGALARTTVHEYDSTYEFSTGMNETAIKEYDYVVLDQATAQTIAIGSVPTGTLLRKTEKTYLDATNQAYRDRNLLGLVTSVTVKDAAENVLAQNSVNYDEGGQFAQLNDYSNVVNWTDPQTTYRGNPTTTSRWLNFNGSTLSTFPNGAYLTIHAQYDQCGSVRKTWDARDTTLANPSQVSYSDSFSDGGHNTYAFPTSMTTAVPDPNGAYGSNVAFTASTVYDFNTGRVMSATDANGQTTNFDYTDPLNRIRQITAPNGARVRYNYSDVPGDLYVQTLSDEDTRSIETRKYFDNLGRAIRGFLYDGTPSTPWSVTDTYYDIMGRVSQVSNPYRVSSPGASVPATCSVCTTSAYDDLGRVTTVTTPDNAQVTTAYAGSTGGTLGTTVTVTDQAGKQRRSLTDALGRLVRVDEPDVNGALGDISSPAQPTSYDYDLLGHLLHVYQGSQTRTFTYDSLSRLLSASNPESGAVCYGTLVNSQCQPNGYDANGNLVYKTDARGILTTYGYDTLNRNISITYTNDPANTPAVTRTYDNPTTGAYGKGRLWSTQTSSGTLVTIDSYDALGRTKSQKQQFYYNNAWSQPYSISAITYDLAGHVTSITYPSQHTVNYNYDGAGRLADKDAQNLAFTGNLGDGTVRTYSSGISYSPFGGIAREQYGTTTPLYHKTFYNIRGQMFDTRVSSVNDTWDWNRGRLIWYYSSNHAWGGSGTDNNGNVVYAENWLPQPNQTGDQGQFLIADTYSYDSLNRLSAVNESSLDIAGGGSWAPQLAQSYIYDRYGNRTINTNSTATYGGVNNKDFSVNTANNGLGVPNGQSGAMTYDNAGNLTTDTYSAAAVTRAYDGENRMTSETTYNSVVSGSYGYDGDGRRVRRIVTVSGQQVETWQVYGIGGELLAEYAANASPTAPQKEYGYRNGQLLITATVTGGWGPPPSFTPPATLVSGLEIKLEHLTELRSAVNQLRQHAGLSAATWTADPDSQRNVTTIKADHIRQLRAALEDARGHLGLSTGGYAHPTLTENSSLIYAIDFQELRDQVLSAWNNGGVDVRWLVSDQLGTPRMIFDQSGSLANVSRHDYLPFSEELFAGTGGRTTALGYTNNDGTRQKFTSKERDNETGLDYFGARYYASTQGRFTSHDPDNAGSDIRNPQTWNGYTYAQNNPLIFVDPDGLDIEVKWSNGKTVTYGDSEWETIQASWIDQGFTVKGGKIYSNGEDENGNSVRTLIGTYQSDMNELGEAFISEMANRRSESLYRSVTYMSYWMFLFTGPVPEGLPAIGPLSKALNAGRTVELLPQFSESTIQGAVRWVMDNPTKVIHLFGKAEHDLEPLVARLGGEENTVRAVLNALNGKLPSVGRFEETVSVGGQSVHVSGNVVNGVPKIGTMFVPK